MGKKWVTKDKLPEQWVCTHGECCSPALYGRRYADGAGGPGACAEHAEAMGVPASLRNPQPTRTRIHVGWRVVREREVDGVKVREWLTPLPHDRWSTNAYSAMLIRPAWRDEVDEYVYAFGGRVVKVFLSYGRGR